MMEKRKKTVNKTIELPVSSRVQGQLSYDKLQAATSSESMMAKADRDEADRLNSKNSVEEYIYEIRGKICDELEDFMLEGDREKFQRELTDAEDWLYEDSALNNCKREDDDRNCIKLTDKVEFRKTETTSEDLDMYKKANNRITKRPGWGNVYNYGVMHGDYQTLEPSLNESFMGDCKVFYDFVYALAPDDDEDDY